MKLKRVHFTMSYIVPEERVREAADAVYEDLLGAFKYNELPNWMVVEDAPPEATMDDVPDFLKDPRDRSRDCPTR